MITADGPAKVKRNATLLALFTVLSWLAVPPHHAHAQLSEKEVQGMEEEEYGLDSGKKAPPAKREQQQETPTPSEDEPAAPKETKDKNFEDHQKGAEPEKIKPIEAEEFPGKVIKKSRSGRVLMIEDGTENRPRPGKILLLKNGQDDVAAVRVLKNYPGKFAAKIVLRFRDPELNVEYRNLKKLGDKIIALLKENAKRGKDLDEAKTDEDLAKEVAPDDNELDRGIPAPKPKATKKVQQPKQKSGADNSSGKPEPLFTKDGGEISAENVEVTDEDEPFADLAVSEDLPLEPKRHAISLEYASMKSVDKDDKPASYSGLGIRYAFNFYRMAFIKKKTIQDMFTAELGLFYYSITGFAQTDDTVKVYPLILNARYNILVGETLMFYGYLGFIKNNVSRDQPTTGTLTASTGSTDVLNTTKLSLGLGAMFKIGPSWAIRLDYGTDLFAVGAVLKF